MGNSTPTTHFDSKKSFSKTESEFLTEKYINKYSKSDTKKFDYEIFKQELFNNFKINIPSLLNQLQINLKEPMDFDDYITIVHFLTKSFEEENGKCNFYYRLNSICVVYDIFTGKKGSFEQFDNSIVRILLEWLFEGFLTYCVQHNKELIPDNIEHSSYTIKKINLDFKKVSELSDKFYNLEPFLYQYMRNCLLVRPSPYVSNGLPIPFTTLKTITASQYFLFTLMCPHVYSKKFCYKLFDCNEVDLH